MMKLIFFIFSGLLLLPGALAQSPAWKKYDTRSAGISLNLHWMQLNDAHFSPLLYNGPGSELKIISVRTYGELRRNFSLGAKADYLRNRYGFNSYHIKPEFRGGLGFKFNDLSTRNATSYLGGEINATSRLYRFVNEDPDHIYWATSYTLEFNYTLDIDMSDDRKAFFEIKFPVGGMVSRPYENNYNSFQLPGFNEYMKRLHENFHFATWDQMQALNMQLLYDLSRTRRSSVTLGYELDFARFSRPSPAMYFTNSLFIRIFYDVFVW
jgi:hypothetical protein